MLSLVKMTLAFVMWLAASLFAMSQPSLQSDAGIDLTLPNGPVSVGGLAMLKCTVNGAVDVFNFTWLHNGRLIMERNNPIITIEHGGNVSKLSIFAIPIDEGGNYTCMAYTSNSSTPLQTSYMLDLHVSPQITTEPDQFTLLGKDAFLKCMVMGNPLPVLTWKKNGVQIQRNGNVRYSEPMLGVLKIANTTAEDAGVYECAASSTIGTDTVNFTLTILTIPVIQSQPNTSVEAGMQAILHCDATGIDTPTISWRSGGLDVGISNGSRLRSYANGSLVIANAKVLDSGNYTCIATNRAGSTNFTTTLNVTGPPVLLVPPKDTVVKAGTTAMLHCSFLANPNNARIQWQGIDDNVLTASDKHSILDNGTLVIRDATDKDNGEYQCTVTNSRGNNTIMANLTVINQPYTPGNFRQTGTTGAQTFTVSWEAPDLSNTTRPVSDYLIILSRLSDGQQIENSTARVPHNRTQHTFTDLFPGNEYKLLIAAQNPVGTSNYSDPVHIETPATVPALEYFTATQFETDEAKLIFMWKVKYDGGHDIINFAIQYLSVQDASEDAWTDLFTRGLDETMETYKPESLPPPGNYVFRAVIGNMLGNETYNDTTEINISEAIPGQPSKPVVSEITSDSVTLDFNLEFMGTGIVNQFVVKVTGGSEKTQEFPTDDSINSSSNVTVRVDGLEADSTYRFQVAAMNDIGIGPFSEMSNEITTENDGTFVYIIVGAVGGFVIIVAILLVTLFVCYMCHRRMKAHKHQISINGMAEKTKVQVNHDSSDATDDSNGFMPHFDKPLPKYSQYNSSSTILSPIERSRSLQYRPRNESFGPASSTISYGSSVATRTASLLHSQPNNNYMTPRGQMYNSATMINYGAGSPHCNTMDCQRWSPPSDFSQRERRSPSSTYHSDTIGRITNMATDV